MERRLNRKGYSLIAGVDEAGRGPLAGPVVACAVILEDSALSAHIDDSKALTAGMRERAYSEIVKKSFIGIGIVDEKTIDEINIYQATRLAMEKALSGLEVPPEYILIDGRIKVKTSSPTRFIIRGDSKCLSIAAASIVAKVTRDALMREYDSLYPAYGFKAHKGYPTRRHKEALLKHGPSPIHRRSYAPVREALRGMDT